LAGDRNSALARSGFENRRVYLLRIEYGNNYILAVEIERSPNAMQSQSAHNGQIKTRGQTTRNDREKVGHPRNS
jgi:hypothetical protein